MWFVMNHESPSEQQSLTNCCQVWNSVMYGEIKELSADIGSHEPAIAVQSL